MRTMTQKGRGRKEEDERNLEQIDGQSWRALADQTVCLFGNVLTCKHVHLQTPDKPQTDMLQQSKIKKAAVFINYFK